MPEAWKNEGEQTRGFIAREEAILSSGRDNRSGAQIFAAILEVERKFGDDSVERIADAIAVFLWKNPRLKLSCVQHKEVIQAALEHFNNP